MSFERIVLTLRNIINWWISVPQKITGSRGAKFYVFSLLLWSCLTLFICAMPFALVSSPERQTPTLPSSTQSATATETAPPSETATATVIIVPSSTTPPTIASAPTNAPIPTHTLETNVDAVVSGEYANLRSGPDIAYDQVGSVYHGDMLTILGKNTDGSWLQVRTSAGQTVWIAGWLVQVDRDLSTVSVVSAPPLPTSPPVAQPPVEQPPVIYPTPILDGVPCQHRRCTEMTSCEEAYACLNAGYSRLDSDHDGVPCEEICPGGD
jgi:uncharacterized protein YraI